LKKIILYFFMLLDSHPELKPIVKRIIKRFPKIEKLGRRVKSELPVKGGRRVITEILRDAVKWFLRRGKIQKIVVKVHSLSIAIERRLQRLIIPDSQENREGNLPKEIPEAAIPFLSPSARRFYFELKKSVAVKETR